MDGYEDSAGAQPVTVGAHADGSVTYTVNGAPEALPCVRARDLALAWDAARKAAGAQKWGQLRGFRFRQARGGATEFALADPDACCWAAAVDETVGLHTSYGLSVCLRLLALVDLLARARWAASFFAVSRGQAELHPSLLRLAATERLTESARFDEPGFRERLAKAPRRRTILTGAQA
jgi:hypothetical protein